MTAYYDGIRAGIASYRGVPHIYESQFQDADDGSDVFLLQLVDDETFQLAMEDWAIWCRWERAFRLGLTTSDTHPALPDDSERHIELAKILDSRLALDPERAIRMRGRFEVSLPGVRDVTSSTEFIVHWLPDETNPKA